MQANPNTGYSYQNLTPGTHKLCLYFYVNNTFLCDSTCKYVTIANPCGTLTPQWNSTTSNDTVSFFAYDTNSVAHHFWNFGDGSNTASGTTATHVYTTPGTYHVCFYDYIPGTSCSDSLCESITITANVTCGTAAFSLYTLGDTVIHAYSTSTGVDSTYDYVWKVTNTGTGVVVQTQGGSNNYFASQTLPAGTYSVCLLLYHGSQHFCDSICHTVTLAGNACGTLTAQWAYQSVHDTVYFSASDTNTAAHHYWVFGDGTASTINSTTATHVYTTPGTYTVCFHDYIPGTNCNDSLCRTITIASNCGTLTAYYYETVSHDTVSFIAVDTNSIAHHIWNFGDGTYSTSNSTTATHVYTTPGTYHVCFYDYIPGTSCNDSFCRSIVITSSPNCGTLTAYYYFTTSHDTVSFTAIDTNSIAHHYWVFGDGSSSTVNSTTATHVYSNPGTYTACFYDYIPGTTCLDSMCRTITIAATVGCGTASFQDYVYGDTSIHAFSSSTGVDTATIYVWNVRNVNSGVLVQSQIGYTNYILTHALPNGTYSVCLLLYEGTNHFCDSICHTITIASCNGITASWSEVSSHDSAYFVAADTNTAAHHVWNFGDGSSTYGTTTTMHVYAQAGTYRVCLYVYIPGSPCTDSLCQYITVGSVSNCGTLTAYWNSTTSHDTVSFYAYDTTSSAHHYWNFGDGTSSTVNSTTATHIYANPGTYHVCFYDYIPGTTCSDSMCRDITITSVTSCGTAGFQYYVYGDTSIHAYSNSSGVNSSTIYVWQVTNLANGMVVFHQSGQNNYMYTNNLPNGTYVVCLFLYNSNQQFCDSICHDVTISNCHNITAYWTSVTSGDTVSFVAIDTNTSAHHYWNFGDGSSGSGTTETHVYAAPGTYHVCLYVYIPGSSCTDSLCQNITIAPTVNCGTLTANWTYTTSQNTVNFVAADTNTTAHHIWNFGDGNSAYGTTTTSHVYPNYGVYHVCLYVYIPGTNCIDSLCQNITIGTSNNCGNITSAFTYTLSNNTVSFVTQDTSSISYHVWTFGDGSYVYGTTSTTHTYNAGGTYTACLHTYIPGTTCSDSTCVTINIGSPCIGLSAAWTPVFSSNGTVQFFAADTAAGVTHYWHFGDGSVGTGIDPVHTYAQGGAYHVCQYVYVSGSNCLDSSCYTIQVAGAPSCQANFSYTLQTNVIDGVEFHNLSTSSDSIISYRWYFGDTTYSTAVNPNHTYSHTGTFIVCLYITTSGGCNSHVCDTVHVTNGNPCQGLSAAWTYSPQGNHTDSIEFNSVTTNPQGTSNYWTLGDGSATTQSHFIHGYAQAGTYTVCHIVAFGNCRDTSCQSITVSNHVNCGTASFNAGTTGNSIVAYSTSTGVDSTTNYYWVITDANGTVVQTQGGQNHYLTSQTLNNGTYTVCLYLYATTNVFCDSACKTITVGNGNPCSGLDASFTYTYAQNGGIYFSGAVNNNSVTNLWYFGDGTYSTQSNPLHNYTQGGLYTVCHIVSIPGATCADTSCQSVQGSGNGGTCHANFTFTSTGNTVTFTSTSTSSDSIVSYSWNFGDGNSSTGSNTHHTYSNSGAYLVCLTITSSNGCTNTYCDSVHAGHNATACQAAFTYTFDSCNVVAFTNTSTGGFTVVKWYFGDGTTDSTLSPTHTYAAGTYNVYLIVSNPNNGCSEVHTETITVQPCNATVADTVCGVVFSDLNGNGVQDPGEPGIAGAEVHIGNYIVHADSTGHYVITVPSGTYYIYYCAPAGYTFTIPVNSLYNNNGGQTACGVYQQVQIINGSNCGYNFGIQNNSVTICGLVFFDVNNNGIFDANSESGIANVLVTLKDSLTGVIYNVYTDQYGHYCAVVPAGIYNINITLQGYTGATINPGSITVAATTSGGTYSNNDFAVYTQPGICDLNISITPNTTITPGYPAWYEVQVCNVGSNTTSGTVNLFYDPSLKFNYASPVPTSQNSSTFTVSWALNNLLPGNCQYYYVSLTTDSNVVPGQFIFTLANVTTNGCNDANLNNNVDTLHQNAQASWDPNNKLVYPTGVGPQGFISDNQELLYTVNFQNVGNAPAVNIVIHDSISDNLDIETFHVVGASHPYTMQFTGREAIWKFNAIMLPDSSVNEPASHGFVRYAIKPLQGLADGTPINNTADIFFDYNEGVRSNTTLNTINYKLSVNDIKAGTATITLQPNPFSQYTIIKIEGAEAPYDMVVYDMLGNVVRKEIAGDNTFTIQRGTLASGMYMYEVLQQGKIIGKGKMVAQ